ncbi:MAG: bifunctional demethylmenaquinone methyltransferase/2-methoxy-6-polyprenyl-1,4-benzoquinol methylase UbiE [Rickettsiales bacterium]
MAKNKTHFGFKDVSTDEKEPLVQSVFSTVAAKYDIMNDFMSFGLHRAWKAELAKELNPAEHEVLLDVAGGTGDIGNLYLAKGGKSVIISDLNKEMLEQGKLKHRDPRISWVQANGEKLPFNDESFDYYTISFGIRNVTNIDRVLAEAFRVLKKGGKFICLEFSDVENKFIKAFYDFYSFKIIPRVGQLVANSPDSYQYLVESIRKFPRATIFRNMIEDAGFCQVEYRKLSFGVVAIHIGYKQ